MRRFSNRCVLLLLVAGCQPQARRALVLDLTLSEPALVDGTARPWREAGFFLEYRRFYPHLAQSDLARYRVLLLLLGREPEAPSDALTSGDLLLLDQWVKQGGAVVLGYVGDDQGSLDRGAVNQWLAWEGTGIAIDSRVADDTSVRARALRPPLWAEGWRLGDHPLGSLYGSFPLERNHLLDVKRSSEIVAVTSRRPSSPGGGSAATGRVKAEPVVAACRIGDGLVVVISRSALAALGPAERPPAMPVLDPESLADTRSFLIGLARWVRRPAEWAHVPPAEHSGSKTLAGPSLGAELQASPSEPPAGGAELDTLPLTPTVPAPAATGIPDWIRETGVRALWSPLLVTRGGGDTPRTSPGLDSLVRALDLGGFNLLAGDAAVETVADSLHHYWDERAAVRRAWRDVVNVLQPTSVAWIPTITYRRASRADSSHGSLRGGGFGWGSWRGCVLDSLIWEGRIVPSFVTVARLASGLRQLIPAVALEIDSLPGLHVGNSTVGQEFCDPAWQHVLARMGPTALRDSIAPADRLRALREAGLLARYYATLDDVVVERARALRDHVLRERPGLYFAFRFPSAPGDWLSLALLRGFSLPERPLILFTPEVMTRDLLAAYRARGINAVHAMQLAPASMRARSVATLTHALYSDNDGFWLSGSDALGDTVAQVLRRVTR